MRVKLDENLPIQLKRLFTESGHDAATVVDEGLGGASDTEIAAICIAEQRVLVTQDLDFSDIRTTHRRNMPASWCSGYPVQRGMLSWRWPPS